MIEIIVKSIIFTALYAGIVLGVAWAFYTAGNYFDGPVTTQNQQVETK